MLTFIFNNVDNPPKHLYRGDIQIPTMDKKRGSGRESAKSAGLKSHKHRPKSRKKEHENLLERIGLEIKDEIPVGIRVLTIYTLLLSVVYLFAAIISPTAIIMGNLVAGPVGKIINVVYVAILLTLAYGFVTRRKWVWRFALCWYLYAMIDAIVSGFSINSYFDLLLNLVIAFLLFTFIANALMLWYVYQKRSYFLQHNHPKMSQEDRVFITMIILVVLFFSVIATLTIAKFFHDTSITVNKVAVELKAAFPGEESIICRTKDLPERDICYLTVSIMQKNTEFCESITSDFYKLTCYRGDLLKS